MTNSLFDEICYNNFCHNCKYNSEQCFPLALECPEQDNILALYNACWLSSVAEEAMYLYDEDDPIGEVLCKCYYEQDDLCDKLIQLISECVAA